MDQVSIGESIYLDATQFLMGPKNRTQSHYGWSVGDIVCTKYGPRLTCEVVAVRLRGLSARVLDIDYTKEGYYKDWGIYKEVINNPSLSDEQKWEELLWALNTK